MSAQTTRRYMTVAGSARFFYTTCMIYCSHRGANRYRVQNTVPAFQVAHEQGARYFELDVHLLADGQLAVHHDYDLVSAHGQTIRLAEISGADLRRYPLVNPFTSTLAVVPLLQDVLPVVAPDLQLLNIELKNDDNRYPGIEKILLDTLADYPAVLPHVLFSSFDYDTLARLRALWPQARIGLLTRQCDVGQAHALRAESVHINYTRFTPQIAQVCHENGLKIYVYTVNAVAVAGQLEQTGADGIFTDCIDLFV